MVNLDHRRNLQALYGKINPTKASELRSQSVLASKTLVDYERSLDTMKMSNAIRNEHTNFSEMEKEKQKIIRLIQLPPIERYNQVQKSLN